MQLCTLLRLKDKDEREIEVIGLGLGRKLNWECLVDILSGAKPGKSLDRSYARMQALDGRL